MLVGFIVVAFDCSFSLVAVSTGETVVEFSVLVVGTVVVTMEKWMAGVVAHDDSSLSSAQSMFASQ